MPSFSIHKAYWAFLLSLIVVDLSAQRYDFRNYTTENGLPQAQILSIAQDSLGRIWLGSNDGGVTIFNGIDFDHITTEDDLSDNIVFDIAFDSHGEVLIGTNNGLNTINAGVIVNHIDTTGTFHNRVFCLEKTISNNYLIGTGKGVLSWNNGALELVKFAAGLDSASVFRINYFGENDIWFSTFGHGVYHKTAEGLKRYSNNNGLKENYVYSVFKNSDQDYWICSSNGIYRVNPDTDNVAIPLLKDKFESFGIHFYTVIKAGKDYWFGTSEGVYHLSKRMNKLTTKNGLVHNDIWRIFEDREGNLWFGSKQNGLSVLSGLDWAQFSTSERDGEEKYHIVNHVSKTQDGILMLSTQHGFSMQYNDKSVCYDYSNGLTTEVALCSVEADDGSIWVGTNSGIGKLVNGRMQSFDFDKATQNGYNRCYDILKDANGGIWFATHAGLARLENGKPVALQDFQDQPNIIFDLYQSIDGSIWLGCESGLYLREEDGYRKMGEEEGIPEKRINSIAEDRFGNLWVATNEGVYYFKEDKFNVLNTGNGLSSNNAYSLGFDAEGAMWIGQPNGVDRLMVDKKFNVIAIKHFDADNGFIGRECTDNSIYVNDKDREVYFGTINGLMVYRYDRQKTSGWAPQLVLREVNLFNEATDWTAVTDSVLSNGLPYQPELSFRQNYFTFHFVGINHAAPKKVVYQYKLNGIDKGWLALTNKTEAVYSNLPPGKYEFVVKAANENMVWSDPVKFKFRILPPFYQTWWFYSLCAAIIVAGIFSYFKIRSSNTKITKQNAIIEEKNADLEQAYSEIAQTNKNITDSIRYAKRLQDAILPTETGIKEKLGDAFIYYNPKDIVSGDFYWLVEKDEKVYVSAIDCTGHGVPGALVSIVGNNGLMRAVNEFGLRKPSNILDKLCELVEETLRQNDQSEVKDGMDMALCSLDRKNMKLNYAGANNPLYIIRKRSEGPLESEIGLVKTKQSNDKYCLYEIKADKQPIGSYEKRASFTNHALNVKKGDHVYMFSDGYADQFGGLKGKKFLYKSLRELLLGLGDLSMSGQKNELKSRFETWKAGFEQVDDVCVVGFTV